MNGDFRFSSRWAMHNEISMNEGDAYSKERMQQEMELQLHQQYAENNNANLGSVVTLIVALLAVFAGYGYVYLHSTLEFSDCFKKLCKDDVFTLDAVLLTATAAYVVLGIMYYICVSQGMKQRMEQFVTFAIRAKYYARKVSDKPIDRNNVSGLSQGIEIPELLMEDSYLRVFPIGYHPFKKTEKASENTDKRIENLSQGLFGDLLPVVKFVGGLLTVSLLLKLGCNICVFHTNPHSCIGLLCLGVMVGTLVIMFRFLSRKNRHLLDNYNDRVAYYRDVMGQSYNLENSINEH